MVIASKLPPRTTGRTYFNSGRAAFAYIVSELAKPRRVWLPAYTCWSLVSTMDRRFPDIQLCLYPVERDLTAHFPRTLEPDELLVRIHYFGYTNDQPLPVGGGILEDRSHNLWSRDPSGPGRHFGSLRKMARIADGGFVDGFHNPVYEPTTRMDTWLRFESIDWRDMREAENMSDRNWQMADMSSQSLAVFLSQDRAASISARRRNERILAEGLTAGQALRPFASDETPLLHQRLFETTRERDELRAFLRGHDVYASIHWPTHPTVAAAETDLGDTQWLEAHSLAFPVSSEYQASDMEKIVDAVHEWSCAGC